MHTNYFVISTAKLGTYPKKYKVMEKHGTEWN